MTKLTAERARELFHYDLETGQLSWRVPYGRWGKFAPGPISSAQDSYGYLRVRVDGVLYRAHRICWLHACGVWPSSDIDHINGIKTDNRFCNMRDVPECINMQNRKRNSGSKTGMLGVGIKRGRRGPRWYAQIRFNGQQIHLGTYATAEAAQNAYLAAKRLHHPGSTL